MRKLNSMTLDALRAVIPVLSEKEQSACIGGGSGSELTPFSMEEFTGLFHDGIWKGGYVQLENDGLSSSICYVSSTGGIENYSGDSAVGVKALAARIGSGSVDDEPTPNHDGCTCGADCDPCMTGSGCEDCLARLEGSGLIDDSGLIDGSGELDTCSGCTTCEESGSGCWSECETCHGDEEGDENVIELPEIIVTPGGNSGNSGGDNNSSGSGNSGTDFGGIIDDIINNNHNSGGNTGGSENSGNSSNSSNTDTSDSDIKISFTTNGSISEYSIDILEKLDYEGNIVITSTARTPERQAKAMLDNILKSGVSSQLDLYASAGDMVIRTYNPNLDYSTNLKNMTAKIYEVGPSKVSKHCADFSKVNVFDVSISSLSSVSDFKEALSKAGISYIDEPQNGCIHVEILQNK